VQYTKIKTVRLRPAITRVVRMHLQRCSSN